MDALKIGPLLSAEGVGCGDKGGVGELALLALSFKLLQFAAVGCSG